MNQPLFLLGDADNVRKKMQGLLLSGNLDALKALSSALSRHVAELSSLIENSFAADIVFCGGDELLARVEYDKFNEGRLRELTAGFKEKTGITISFGVGRSVEEAFTNLSRAKSAEPGSIFSADRGASAANPADQADS